MQTIPRRLALALGLVLALAPPATAGHFPRPARPIDAAAFDQLLAAVRAEPSSDGRLGQLRNRAGGRAFLFSAGQAIAILGCFDFWADRLVALRLLPPVPGDAATVLRWFDDAPEWARSEARRILSV